jgi:hypothetical protein
VASEVSTIVTVVGDRPTSRVRARKVTGESSRVMSGAHALGRACVIEWLFAHDHSTLDRNLMEVPV